MLAAHMSASGDFLNAQDFSLFLGIVTLIFAVASFVLAYLVNGILRRRIIYGMTVSAQMINPPVEHPNLHILWRKEEITDPHILEIDIVYKGRVDITDDSFNKGRPLSLDINAPIIDILETIV
ncbi:MAG: hypothetical protein ACRDNF_14115, partial [Streptosporangiaceae bacterium]